MSSNENNKSQRKVQFKNFNDNDSNDYQPVQQTSQLTHPSTQFQSLNKVSSIISLDSNSSQEFNQANKHSQSSSPDNSTPSNSTPPSPSIPQLAVPIPFGESDGLPSAPNSKSNNFKKFTKKANKLIKLRHSHQPSTYETLPSTNSNDIESASTPIDPFSLSYKPPKSKGILSSLLSVYNHNHHHSHSKPSNIISKQRRLSSDTSDSELSASYHNEINSIKFPPLSRSTSEPDIGAFDLSNKRSPSTPEMSNRQYKPSAFRIPDPLRLRPQKYRPKTARSSAGVFGALITSGQNLTGAVTPQSTAIVPNLKHSGYRLQRYSLDPTLDIKKYSANANDDNSTKTNTQSQSSSLDLTRTRTSSLDLDSINLPKSDSFTTTTSANAKANKKSTQKLFKDQLFQLPGFGKVNKTPLSSPDLQSSPKLDYFSIKENNANSDHVETRSIEQERKARKKNKYNKRKKEELYITIHVATVLHRQEFIMKLSRALMMFGAPSHRLEAQLQATARVLDVPLQVVYLPGLMLFSFGDPESHTSETKFLKQSSSLHLRKLLKTHELYWKVTHDEMSVSEASKELDFLMTQKDSFNALTNIIIAGFCSAFITPFAFSGSFVDACLAAPLGMLLVGVQTVAVRNDLFTNIFEITMAALNSLLAASLAQTGKVCYAAVASGSVVLILPGYIILCGALELSARNIIAGSVRMFFAIIYSLFLGVGLSIGAQLYRLFTNREIEGMDNQTSVDYSCSSVHHGDGPWYQQTIDPKWYILCVPLYALFISLRNKASFRSRELILMIITAICGYTVNYFVKNELNKMDNKALSDRVDLSSAIGSFVIGLIGNLWGKFTTLGSAFTMTASGIMLLLPTGLSNNGILQIASGGGNEVFGSGLGAGGSLIQAAIGLTVGLFAAAVVAHPFGGTQRRRAAIFSF